MDEGQKEKEKVRRSVWERTGGLQYYYFDQIDL